MILPVITSHLIEATLTSLVITWRVKINSFYALPIINNLAIFPTTELSCSTYSHHICSHTSSWHRQYTALNLVVRPADVRVLPTNLKTNIF